MLRKHLWCRADRTEGPREGVFLPLPASDVAGYPWHLDPSVFSLCLVFIAPSLSVSLSLIRTSGIQFRTHSTPL